MLVKRIIIDYDKCDRCKKCVEVCTYGALEWFDGMSVVVNSNNCKDCRECERVCPNNAITIINE
jgi:NAD-dependent dihydropyrimidine dehydrogenase PreA subunit